MCLPCPTRLWHQVVFHAKLAPSTHDPQTILTSAFRAFWLPVLPQFFEVLLGVLPVEYNLARSILAIHFRPTWRHCYPQQSCANVCCSTTESYLRPAVCSECVYNPKITCFCSARTASESTLKSHLESAVIQLCLQRSFQVVSEPLSSGTSYEVVAARQRTAFVIEKKTHSQTRLLKAKNLGCVNLIHFS